MSDAQAVEEVAVEDESVVVIDDDAGVETAGEQPVETKSDEPAAEGNPEDYSSRVKKRISQEVAKRHEAERRSAAAEERLIKLQQAYNAAQANALTSGESAIEAQKMTLQRDYDDAYNSGDTSKMFEVQDKLSRLNNQSSDFERRRQEQERWESSNHSQAQTQQQFQQQQSTQKQQAQPEPKAVEWARRNNWFGQDEILTGSAYAIHNRLVNSEGYDTTSDEYYEELDRRLKDAFPQKFGQAKARSQQTSPVAGVTRGSNKRTIKLTQAQLDVCKRLGVSPKDYARYVE